MSHLLDYNRNPINVVHLNCGISPPPGLPLGGAPEDVAPYLRSQGISWIAAHETFWTPARVSRQDPEVIRQWSEAYDTSKGWDSRCIYTYYLMAKCIRSLIAKQETRRFDNDLVLINLERDR